MSKFVELECGGEPVVVEITNEHHVLFHGWDKEAEEAAIELGFEPSAVMHLWESLHDDSLNHGLTMLCMNGNVKAVEAIILAGADPYHCENAPIRFAATHGHVELVEFLTSLGADVTQLFGTGIQVIISHGDVAMIELLLEAGRLDERHPHWIEEARRYGQHKIARVIEEHFEEKAL